MKKILIINSLFLLLFLYSCEEWYIAEPPYKIIEIRVLNDGKIKYILKSISNPKRKNEVITNDRWAIGDTLILTRKKLTLTSHDVF